MAWDSDADAVLTRLVNEGAPFALIAQRLGRTRNACIGRSQRLGVSAASRGCDRVRVLPPTPCSTAVGVGAPHNALVAQDESRGKSLLDLSLRQCRFPIDQREEDGCILFCAAPTAPGKSFCAAHHRIAYVPTVRKVKRND